MKTTQTIPRRKKMVLPKKITLEMQACLEEIAIAKVIKKQRKKEGLELRNVNSFTKNVKDRLKILVTDKAV